MLIAENFIRHNGTDYKPGDELPGMLDNEAERLIKLGVAKIFQASKTVEEPVQNTENNTDRNYEEWDYNDVKKEVKERGLKTQGSSRVELTEALKADDIEFDGLILELEALGIELPEEATTNELKELLNQSNNSEVSNND